MMAIFESLAPGLETKGHDCEVQSLALGLEAKLVMILRFKVLVLRFQILTTTQFYT